MKQQHMTQILNGTILDVNAKEYTAHVRAHDMNNRSYDLENVPFLSRSVNTDIWGGSVDIPERLSACLVLKLKERYYILDILPALRNLAKSKAEAKEHNSITRTKSEDYSPDYNTEIPSAEKRHYDRKFQISARTNRPHDAIPGDKFWKTREGAFWGVLRGGLVMGRVSEFCQFFLSKIDHLFRLVSRNIQVFTDWGKIEIKNDKNNTNMGLRAGEAYKNNKAENFTVHLDVGAVGDLIHLRVTETSGDEKMRTQVFPDGRIETQSVHSVYTEHLGSHIDLNNNKNVYMLSEIDTFINAKKNMYLSVGPNNTLTISRGNSRIGFDEQGDVYIESDRDMYIKSNGNTYINNDTGWSEQYGV